MAGNILQLLDSSRQSVQYMTDEITHICRDMKSRAPGSVGEREAADYMAEVLRKECGCNNVKTETFTEHPAAFYCYFYITSVLGLICAGSFFILPWLSMLIGIITLLFFLFQFVLYKQIIDPLLPEKKSVNVTAIRPCSGEVRQRVFLNGHIDAAWEFPMNYHFGGVVFEIPGIVSVFGVSYYTVISVCRLCGAGRWAFIAGLCGLIFVPAFVILAFTYNKNRIVDGANDNLTGCYMGITLLREMERLGIDPEHTELGVILTGSEEAGLRGAKAWSKAHKDDYKDVPTYIVAFDTIHDPRYLMVNRKDLNGTVAADKELCDLLVKAAKDAGVIYKNGQVPLFGGATDGAAFTQGGFRAACVTGLNHKLEDYYHTRRDSFDNLNAEGLEKCYRATVSFISRMEDGNGI